MCQRPLASVTSFVGRARHREPLPSCRRTTALALPGGHAAPPSVWAGLGRLWQENGAAQQEQSVNLVSVPVHLAGGRGRALRGITVKSFLLLVPLNVLILEFVLLQGSVASRDLGPFPADNIPVG